ncbi:unnamed protein product [Symbiodinium natans]|uniref:Uncharacterized protein n=1 Tax=Symbiodinium natans TaxID=878477 RepID=A0A812STN5_9DINO|nr:unnamed protein product [Symbiodinium natans]
MSWRQATAHLSATAWQKQLQFVAGALKPLILALLFGPPRPGKAEAWHKPLQILVFIVLPGLLTLKGDVALIRGIVASGDFTWWQRVNAILMVAGSSSNSSTSLCLTGASTFCDFADRRFMSGGDDQDHELGV